MVGNTKKEIASEATIKPTMNLGNRYQISAYEGLSAFDFFSRARVAQRAKKKAAKPMRTF